MNIFEQIEKSTVFDDRNILDDRCIPQELPHRDAQLREIASVVGPILNKESCENMLSWGSSATGKTATAKHLKMRIESLPQAEESNTKIIYITCQAENTEYKVLRNLCNEFAEYKNKRIAERGWAVENLYAYFKEVLEMSRKQVLVILDEIDELRTSKEIENVIYRLTKMDSELAAGRIYLWVIGKTDFTNRLSESPRSIFRPTIIHFPDYNEAELRTILIKRTERAFKKGALPQEHLSFLASEISKNPEADLRTALGILRSAGRLADQEGSKSVTKKHLRRSFERFEIDTLSIKVAALNEHQILIVDALFEIGQPTLTGHLSRAYCKIVKECGLKPVGKTHLWRLLTDLTRKDFIRKDSVTLEKGGYSSDIWLKEFSPNQIRVLKGHIQKSKKSIKEKYKKPTRGFQMPLFL